MQNEGQIYIMNVTVEMNNEFTFNLNELTFSAPNISHAT